MVDGVWKGDFPKVFWCSRQLLIHPLISKSVHLELWTFGFSALTPFPLLDCSRFFGGSLKSYQAETFFWAASLALFFNLSLKKRFIVTRRHTIGGCLYRISFYIINSHFRHFIKSINKRLFKSFKLVSCPNLKLWQKSVSNMLWWSISSSVGKP